MHGNSAAQATVLPLDTETAGTICPAADVDYFTVIAPGPGLVFVDTFGGVQPRGTLWQHERVVAAGPTRGGSQDARLGARVQAGPVVVALQGQGGATGAYAVVVTFVQGYLENPGPESFQSGIGVLSGWVCEAEVVELELNGVPQEAAYGTERLDTAGVCGDTDNGFGLLFNWNLLGDGAHAVVAYVDGVELDRATVTVTTLGQEFVREVEGECVVEDFPSPGERVTLVWQQTSQNFVMAEGSAPSGSAPGRPSGLSGFLENPGRTRFRVGCGYCRAGCVRQSGWRSSWGIWGAKWLHTGPNGWTQWRCVATRTTALGCCSTGICWGRGSTKWWHSWTAQSWGGPPSRSPLWVRNSCAALRANAWWRTSPAWGRVSCWRGNRIVKIL